jgi:hypothetical protein
MSSETTPDPALMALAAPLSFRPFAALPREELVAELGYWEDMARRSREGGAVETTARRHADRCLETLRARAAS